MRGSIGHSTSAAGRTEAAALAREGDQAVVAAVVAVETEKAVRQDAAAKERAKLLLDEAGRSLISMVRSREEVFQLLADDFVQEGLLRLVALVLCHLDPVRDRVSGCESL